MTTKTAEISVSAEVTPGARQRQMKSIFVEHDRYKDAFSAISRAHFPVDGGDADFGSISALIGESRAGKSSVAFRYMKQYEPYADEAGMICPVVYVSIPSDGQKALLGYIADALGVHHTQRVSIPALQRNITRSLNAQNVELLILDEVNTVVRAENRRMLPFVLNLLRKLVDECRLNIVCVGLPETYDLLASDPQVTGRGGLPYQIVEPYSWENEREQKLFRLLCDEFDNRLPFNDRSGLAHPWFSQRLYYSSKGGIVGRLNDFLFGAGCRAINDDAEAIDVQHLAEAYEQIKPRGTAFNPWLHDMSQAPKNDTIVVDRHPREIFTKKRQRKVVLNGS